MLRLAIANIHRPGALTPSVVLSLGLGLAVLVTITQIDGNLRRQFLAALPEHAPSFFFIDIPSTQAEQFDGYLRQIAPGAKVERRADAARADRRSARRPRRGPQAHHRFRMGAAERPRPDLYRRSAEGLQGGRGRMVERRLCRPAAGLDGEEDRRRARPQARRRGRGQRARPRHPGEDRQSAHHRLAGHRHQFRAGVLAQRLQGRAAHPHRDADGSRRRLRPATARSSGRSPTPIRW